MRPLPELIAISTGHSCARERAGAKNAVSAGLPGILVREPDWSDREILSFAEELRARSDSVWIGVHDRAHLALAPAVDAVHLGFRSLPPSAVRSFNSPQKQVGFSAHVHDEATKWSGADYLFFSPIKQTPSKAGLLEPTGLEGLRQFCEVAKLPVVALGGLQPDDVRECVNAGAHGVACLADILGAPEPAERVGAWLFALDECRELRR